MGRCPTGVLRTPAPWLNDPDEPVPSGRCVSQPAARRKRPAEEPKEAPDRKRPRALEA